MSIWLRIGGYAATEIALHSPPTWETWANGGCGAAAWEFGTAARSEHQALRPHESLVQILVGLVPVYTGLLEDYDRNTGACSAYGLFAAGRSYPAFDGTLSNTRNLATAITQAQAMGWQVTNPAPVSGTAAGEVTGNPIKVTELIEQYAEQTGQRAGTDGAGRLYMTPTQTAPSWLAVPDAAAFGITDERQATLLLGRYLDSTTSTYLTASSGSGTPVETLDLVTGRHAMSNAAATAVLTGLLTRDYDGPTWTNGVTLTSDQLQTMGGTPAFLPRVRAGQVMRSLGLSYASQVLALDTVIGKTRYTAGEDSIYLEPVSKAPRSFQDLAAV